LVYLKFRNKRIDEITPADLEDYKAHRSRAIGKNTRRTIRPVTVNRELACLKAMYFHAQKSGHAFKNPVSEVEFLTEHNEQCRVLTWEEQRKYLAAASTNLKDVAALILETGMRPEEVYRIRSENLSLELAFLFNPYGKTKAEIPLNSSALAILKRRREDAEGAYLFPHRRDINQPMLKANNAHTRALAKSKVRAFRTVRLPPHVGHTRGGGWHGHADSGLPTRSLEAEHGVALRAPSGEAPG
jgi:integrase